jgi:hypothetical protein
MNLKSCKNILIFLSIATFSLNNSSSIQMGNYEECIECGDNCYLIKVLWWERCYCPIKG